MQRVVAIVGAFALVVAGIGAFAMSAQADPHPVQKDTVADNSTLGNWSGEVGLENTTENVGRIWTDKTVQDGDVVLTGDVGSVTINKGSSDFLVGLSALSSMSNTMTTSTTPLDIVLVLDMSGSMSNELSSEQQFVYNEVNARNVQGSAVENHRTIFGRTYYTQVDPGDYYVLVDGEYVPVLEHTHTERYESRSDGIQDFNIHDYWYLEDGAQVDPSTTQFYTRRTQTVTTSKIDALKEAVNEFIETTDQANASLPADGKHEISIVKFANDTTDNIGNDRYYLNYENPNVNYSQVVTDFTSDATALENYVNNLQPAGATRADLGLEQAQRVLQGDDSPYGTNNDLDGARENSKKVVIFFTDGQPTEWNEWSADVANTAIQTANEMKNDQNDPVTIYSIGVFEDADPSNTMDNSFNSYMHAVSSNYPNATGYIGTGYWEGWNWVDPNMGDRAPDSDYYKAATSSDELSQIFQGISEDIGSGTGAPTQTEGKDTETTSGYITITDQLGDYMQFDGMKSVVFAGQQFTQVSGPTQDTAEGYEGWIRYTYQGEANNDIYPEGNLNQLIVRVKEGGDLKTGDTVQVQIPASLIPTRYFDVDATAGTMSVTDAYPIRIFYGVSLKGGVADSIAAGAPMGGLSQAEYDELATYARSNQYTKGDTAYASFLSNAWSGGADGTTTSSFEPSSGNEFYYFTKPTTLYFDEACERPVTDRSQIRDGQTYYYKNTFWQFTDENADTDGAPYEAKETFTPFGLTAAQARQLATGTDGDGNVCIPAGTRHTAMISELVENKADGANKTSTATSVINPNWAGSGEDETIDAALGNNGRLGIELPGTLSVTKNIEVPTGVDATQFANTEFPFQITMDDAANYTFKAQVKNADGTIANPGTDEDYFDLAFNNGVSTTVNLKPNQTLTIYGLGDGWIYSVAETGTMPAGFAQTEPADGAPATGTIDQTTPAVAEFTNTYSFEDDVTIPGTTDLAGTKALTPRAWQDGDRFDFELMVANGSTYADGAPVPTENQPMPTDGDKQANGNVRISLTNEQAKGAASGTAVNFNFGDITYTAPGTYNYIIREVDYTSGQDGYVAGVTYDLTRYYVQVVVTDNGNGTLAADAQMYTTHYENGALVPNFNDDVTLATFENTWSATDATLPVSGAKTYSDNTTPGEDQVPANTFFFRITAQDNAPLPQLQQGDPIAQGDDYMVVTAMPAGRFQFGAATFTPGMVGSTYTYTIEEVIEQGGNYVPVSEAIDPNDDGAYVQDGMTYDATKYTLTVTVRVTADGALEAVPEYSNVTATVAEPTFTNSYDPADATLTGDAAIHGTKTITGRDMTGDEHFTFTLVGANTATTTAMTDGTITFGGQSDATYTQDVSGAAEDTAAGFNFGDMVINKDGVYTFYMSETAYVDGDNTYTGSQLDNPINGISFDRHVFTVTVTVTDDGGQLAGKVEYSTADGGAAFTNTYTASETYGTDVDLTVGKTLTGRNMKQGEFTFEISATGDNAEAAQAKLDAAKIASTFRNPQSATDGVESTWQIFENLAFNQDDAGETFTYQVKEQIPAEGDLAGVTYDESVYEVAILVVDDADGTMHTVTTVKKGGEQVGDPFDSSTGTVAPKLSFENSYHGAPVTVDPETDTRLQFNKVVAGRDWLERDNFNFSITKVSFNGATDENALAAMPDPEQDTATLGGEAQADTKADERVPFDFGQMIFTKAGTYVYRVDETNTGNDGRGLTYDEHTVDIAIVISDNNAGNLVVGAIYPLDSASTTFTNTYASKVNYPEAAASLSVQKTLKGHAMADNQFEFTLTPADEASAKKVGLWQDDAPQSETGSWGAAEDGAAVTTLIDWNLTFTQADSGRTYTYTFAEVVPEDVPAGYSYDGTTYTVAITPTDNQDGTMTVTTVVTTTPAEGEATETTYTYSATDAKDDIVLPFVNIYGTDATTDDVAADVDATKTLTGRDMDADEFSFEIVTREADGFGGEFTPATVATGTNAAANNGVAGDVTFTDGNGDGMTYTIAKLEQAVADGYATKTVGDDGNATWTLNYTAQELTGNLPTNVTADDPTSFNFTVTVTDDGAGKLTAEVNLPQGGIAFKNTYKPDDVTVGADGDAKITVQKTFTGRANNAWLDSDSFVFTIATQTDGAPMPENATVEVTNKDNAVDGVAGAYTDIFGDITYTKADLDGAMSKDFVYTITETNPASNGNGITKDTHTATVTVTVTDNGEGQLVAKVEYDNSSATEADQGVTDAAAFTNTYDAGSGTLVGSMYLKASKTLTGRDWQEGEQVDIVLRGDKGTPAPEGTPDTDDARWTYSMHVSENGSFTFPDIKYTAADLGGEDSAQFTYVIRELSDTHTIVDGTEADEAQIRQGMDYALDTYRVVVTVRDAHNGTLDVSAQMYHVRDHDGDYVTGDATGELVADNTAAFENRFDASTESIELTADKVYKDPNNGKPMTDEMFSFRVTAVGDEAATAPMGGREHTDGEGNRYIDASVDAETKDASFGTARFRFDGQNHTFYYEVTENMPAGANEGNGYKVDGVTYDPTVFTVKVEVTYDGQADTPTSSAKMTIYKGSYEEVSAADPDELDAMKVEGITFNNSYGTGGTTVDTGDATTTANFTKVIDGRDWLASDSFQFTITPNGDAPAFEGADDNSVSTVEVTTANDKVDKITDADGPEIEVNGRSFNFGSVTFTDEDMTGATTNPETGLLTKTFTYTVNEVEPADEDKIPGMTYSGNTAILTITVVDNGDGIMTATSQVQNGVFTNSYATSVDGAAFGGFQITKTLTGHAMTAGQFEFTVTPVDGTGTTAADAAAKLGITDDNKKVPSIAADDGETVTVGTFDLADDMKFTQDDAGKTFVYEVSETLGGGTGYKNDKATYRVEIAVEHDAATATLIVTTTVKDASGDVVGEPVEVTNASTERATTSVGFKNSYSASTETEGGTSATVSTTKTLEGRPLEDGEFTFQVAYAGGDKAVVKDGVTNTADGTVDFGSFDYTTETLAQMVEARYATKTVDKTTGNATWKIQYTASEVTDGLPAEGVTASKSSFEFTITVVDNGNGTLAATASLPEGHGFENTYSTNDGKPVSVTPTGNKVFNHADGLDPNIEALAGAYTFTLEPVTEGAPMPEGDGNVATNDEQGNVTFGAIEFTLEDLNQALAAQEGTNAEEGIDTQELNGQPREFTFEYQVTETETNPGTIDYVTVDTEPKTIKYTVHDDGQGTLTVTSDPANAPLFTFTNTYTVTPELSSPTGEGQLTITKTLIGRDMVADEFTFTLTAAADGTEYPATNAAAADGQPGTVAFDPITFTEPGTYQYTLSEVPGADNVGLTYDTDTYTVTANVKDNGQGGLEVTWSINGTQDKTVAFENTYEAKPASMSFGASKVLTGRDLEDGEFSFQVTDETGEALYANGTNDAAGTVNFDPITFNQAGTYHLWISEVLPEDDDAETEGIQSENVTYDETRYELVVTVKDNGEGRLVVTDVEEVDGTPVFENVYTEPVEPVLPGGDSLEQTGDSMPLMMGAVAVAGAALVAGGLAVRRKRGE
ncbi:Spy0128 family protein [uncultured Enorma sp.]|uniref:Spy0128 family protein n=1 Tax=uncultured Enorma sp. TaxID=1714346 RepID=UPI002806031D|nr:FctA domain-containing protein [uncultured Enorma sp.]